MATFYSDYQTKVRAAGTALHTRPDLGQLQYTRRCARFLVTGPGTVTSTEFVVLGSLKIPGARVIPEECKIRFTGTGTLDVKFQLTKQNTAGTQVAITAITATITAVTATLSLTAVASAAADTVSLAATDELLLVLTTGAAIASFPATGVAIVEVVYDSPE